MSRRRVKNPCAGNSKNQSPQQFHLELAVEIGKHRVHHKFKWTRAHHGRESGSAADAALATSAHLSRTKIVHEAA